LRNTGVGKPTAGFREGPGSPITRGAQGDEDPPKIFFAPPGKIC